MRVNPNSDLGGVTRVPIQTGAGDPRLGADKQSFTTADSLTSALEQTPASRGEKVAQAQNLVDDYTYPPPVLIRKIAALLAMNIDAGKGSDQATSD
jgi:hypothetical protein